MRRRFPPLPSLRWLAALALAACSPAGGNPVDASGAGGNVGSAGTQGQAGTLGAGGAAGTNSAAAGNNGASAGTNGAAGASPGAGTSGGAGTGASAGTSGAAGTSASAGTSGGAGAGGGASAGRGGTGASGRGGAGGSATAGRGGTGTGGSAGTGGASAIVTSLDVSDVFSGHPVSFALLTRGNQQFAAFYDTNRQMTVASRALDGTTWRLVRLASTLGWDSHNYVAMAIDSAGFIHVSGNMHAAPLVYFRTTQPLDIGSFQQVSSMVGSNEQSCTYPQFILNPAGELVYAYRDGTSGNGNYIFNIYDTSTKAWRRLVNSPLLDGEGARNAYPVGPTLGPDGWWHLVYVWRDTPDAATNHDLSYLRSRDLVSWQSGTGQAKTLPVTLATSDVVDAVPVMGGMINNNTKVGFDSMNRPVVAYHKYDANGNTQLYNARVEGGRWVTHKTSSWNTRWNFGGGGTLVFEIQLEGVRVASNGSLIQVWYNQRQGGWSAFELDETTLASTATLGRTLPYPVELERVESTTAGMGVRWASDTGAGPDPGILYMLRWETLPENMDQPRSTIPPPTKLRLYGFRKGP